MAIQQFPAAADTPTAFSTEVAVVQKPFAHTATFIAGVYRVVVAPTSTNASLSFTNPTGTVTNVQTTSGTKDFVLATTSTRVFITTKSGGSSNAVVTITKIADSLTPLDVGNGTLDTVNTTGTYNQTGFLSVLAFSGGEQGIRGSNNGGGPGGRGGQSGHMAVGGVFTNAATTVTIGAGGVAQNANAAAVDPTHSSFGNLIVVDDSGFFPRASGGSGSNNGSENGSGPGSASITFPSFNSNSTTGGGGGGAYSGGNTTRSNGGGSGIGTGGQGGQYPGSGDFVNAQPTVRGGNGTGKASGGGGGAATGRSYPNSAGTFGGDGGPGVVYILRGF
jgi:hypothetical protein